jgi:hypothetical protein
MSKHLHNCSHVQHMPEAQHNMTDKAVRPIYKASHSSPTWLKMGLASAILLSACLPFRAHAHAPNEAMSAASTLSALPVAMSVVTPAAVLSAGAVLTVASVHEVAGVTEWVMIRASDGARVVVRWGSQAAGTTSVAAGTAISVTALSAGHLLSVAGEAVAFIPNELGKALLYSNRLPD